jgi:hypothetical protein
VNGNEALEEETHEDTLILMGSYQGLSKGSGTRIGVTVVTLLLLLAGLWELRSALELRSIALLVAGGVLAFVAAYFAGKAIDTASPPEPPALEYQGDLFRYRPPFRKGSMPSQTITMSNHGLTQTGEGINEIRIKPMMKPSLQLYKFYALAPNSPTPKEVSKNASLIFLALESRRLVLNTWDPIQASHGQRIEWPPRKEPVVRDDVAHPAGHLSLAPHGQRGGLSKPAGVGQLSPKDDSENEST